MEMVQFISFRSQVKHNQMDFFYFRMKNLLTEKIQILRIIDIE